MFGQEKEGSLIGILDQTCCAPGARLLRKWITQPLLNKEDILKRQELVQIFFQKENIQTEIRDILNASYDMERLISRLASQRGNARDLKFLAKTIQSIQPIEDILTTIDHPSEYLQHILSSFKKELFMLGEKYNSILQDELPLTIQEG
ncbi:MAG: hypothetical protein U9Q15_01855 [Patescibacteria group bacterium]|nr:hypothetical protein [Patescibacteria group bacterium]